MRDPWHFDIVAGRPLLVLACSQTKRACPAGAFVRFADLYDGPMWRQVKACGFDLARVAAISALYGFLEPGHKVETYDRKMDADQAAEICGRGDHAWRLAQAIRVAGSAFIVGGQHYRRLAETAIRIGPDLADRVTFAGGSYLALRSQLGAWLRANLDQVEAPIAGAAELEVAA